MHFFLNYIKHCYNHFISLSSLKMMFPHLLTSRCMFPLHPWDPFKQFMATSCVSLLVTDLWPWALTSTKFQDTFCIIESYSISSVSCLSSLFKSLPCCPAQLLNLCCTVKYKSSSFWTSITLPQLLEVQLGGICGLFSTEQITIRGPGTVTAVISISLLLFWLKSNLFLMSLSLALHKGVSYKNGFFELRGTDYPN